MKGNVVGCNSEYYYALIRNLYNSGEERCGGNGADAPTHFIKLKLRMCICCIGECTYCEYFEHFKVVWGFTTNYKLHESTSTNRYEEHESDMAIQENHASILWISVVELTYQKNGHRKYVL
jgi:hypothetical protein